jgi:HSP20 family protein
MFVKLVLAKLVQTKLARGKRPVKATMHERFMGKRRLLKDEIDELFADLWQVSRLGGFRHGFRPEVDSFRTESPSAFTIVVDIAGVDPADVHLVAADGTLTISGDRQREACEGRVFQQMEIEYGPFERVVQLPDDVDLEQADARYERGLLMVVIPITPKRTPARRVPIEVETARKGDA